MFTVKVALRQDGWLLFAARFLRLFAYGMLAVVLVLYLTGLGLRTSQIGLFLTLTLLGDTTVSLLLTTRADRFGRRRTLIGGAALLAVAGIIFAFTKNFAVLVIAGTIGIVSPSGNEVGPFLPIEQAALSQVVSTGSRTRVFAWYVLTGSFATAVGSLFAGVVTSLLELTRKTPVESQRVVVLLYAACGIALAAIFSHLSKKVETERTRNGEAGLRLLGLASSKGVVIHLSALFALDAFGGGFVVQSFAAYWFNLRFGVAPATLGGIFFGANLLAGLSALLATRLASQIGLVKTMVFTHLPSNVLLILVPLMPNLRWAIIVLLLRFSISQMDVPTRQSYVMAVVDPEERSAAAGITGVARTTGAAIAPYFAGLFFAHPALWNIPFFVAGTLKITYDLLLYRAFVGVRPPEEAPR
jgi:MFS family permease